MNRTNPFEYKIRHSEEKVMEIVGCGIEEENTSNAFSQLPWMLRTNNAQRKRFSVVRASPTERKICRKNYLARMRLYISGFCARAPIGSQYMDRLFDEYKRTHAHDASLSTLEQIFDEFITLNLFAEVNSKFLMSDLYSDDRT